MKRFIKFVFICIRITFWFILIITLYLLIKDMSSRVVINIYDEAVILKHINGFGMFISWSPDGRHIAFVKNSHIWIVQIDGKDAKNATRLTCDGLNNSPVWISDKEIVFTSNLLNAPSNKFNLWTVDIYEKNAYPVIEDLEVDSWHLDVIPGTKKIICRVYETDGKENRKCSFCIVDLDSKSINKISVPEGKIGNFCCSVDGGKVVYEVSNFLDRYGVTSTHLWCTDLSTDKYYQLTFPIDLPGIKRFEMFGEFGYDQFKPHILSCNRYILYITRNRNLCYAKYQMIDWNGRVYRPIIIRNGKEISVYDIGYFFFSPYKEVLCFITGDYKNIKEIRLARYSISKVGIFSKIRYTK